MSSLALDRIAILALLLLSLFLAGRGWLADHPEHNPWAPLSLDEPEGWATGRKLGGLRADAQTCAAFLERADIAVQPLEPTGEGSCRREDRQQLASADALGLALSPARAQTTCAVDGAFAWWIRHGVEPAARAHLESPVARIEHLGTYNCRRIGGGQNGNWSEHATGNAIDIAAFVLEDGTRISIKGDWKAAANGTGEEANEQAAFLREVRDAACTAFATVLSPDYNAAHADHLHLDQAKRAGGWSTCR